MKDHGIISYLVLLLFCFYSFMLELFFIVLFWVFFVIMTVILKKKSPVSQNMCHTEEKKT